MKTAFGVNYINHETGSPGLTPWNPSLICFLDCQIFSSKKSRMSLSTLIVVGCEECIWGVLTSPVKQPTRPEFARTQLPGAHGPCGEGVP